MRKVIHLVPVPYQFLGITLALRMYALCDDGTIWYRDCNSPNDSTWKRSDDSIPGTLS